MSSNNSSQIETYKILENLSSRKHKNGLKLLESIIQEIIVKPEFEVFGGRVWLLDINNSSYKIASQYGNTEEIPEGFSLLIDENQIQNYLNRLMKEHTIHGQETDTLLREKGINYFYLAGVGEIIKMSNGKYFQYALGFNSDSYSKDFHESLSIIRSLTTVALRNLDEKEEFSILKSDIKKASELQRNLLPDHYLEYRDFKIFGLSAPDRGVSGDYFDYVRSTFDEEEQLSIIISDAASKGLPAAIEALFVSGAIRMGMAFASRISHILAILNNLIHKTFQAEKFVSLFYAELTGASNRLVLYANAGHPSPIHYRPSSDKFQMLDPTGPLLGVLENQKFTVENARMLPGDVLALFTDGINEAQDEEGNLFGDDRIKDIIKQYHNESAKVIAYHLIEEVQKFSVQSIYTDDKTLVIIKRDPKVN
ncbi:MAG: PP2C family protein-serine/threonine phosphatase [Candidatus Kapabacteria bacterium]|nr:PP2C family protein-serine/threonine phosphatase [Candidatus Kapabacteria bacterium]